MHKDYKNYSSIKLDCTCYFKKINRNINIGSSILTNVPHQCNILITQKLCEGVGGYMGKLYFLHNFSANINCSKNSLLFKSSTGMLSCL